MVYFRILLFLTTFFALSFSYIIYENDEISYEHEEDINSQISQQALNNLYILPISTTYEIITIDECPLNTILKCFINSFYDSQCFSNIYNERLIYKDTVTVTNKEPFLNHLKNCSINESKNIKLKYTSLSKLLHKSGGIPEDLNPVFVYPKCMANISACFMDQKCIVPSQYNIFDKIINVCSDEAFKKLNLTFHRSKRPITTYIDDLESLRKNKIGPILDSYTTNFPQKIIDKFGALTYEEFDALKMAASTIPYLKQYFCDSQEDSRISRSFEFIQQNIDLAESLPQLPEKVKNLFQNFTIEMYEIVKYMLSAHPHLRWSFCSPIFAISPSTELTNIFSPPVTIWALRNCREMADQNILTRVAICERPDFLFGRRN